MPGKHQACYKVHSMLVHRVEFTALRVAMEHQFSLLCVFLAAVLFVNCRSTTIIEDDTTVSKLLFPGKKIISKPVDMSCKKNLFLLQVVMKFRGEPLRMLRSLPT